MPVWGKYQAWGGLNALRFNMRLIHDVAEPDTSVFLLGRKLALPFLAAPIGGVSFNMGGQVSEQDYIGAILKGCKEKGIMGCTGDGSRILSMRPGSKG